MRRSTHRESNTSRLLLAFAAFTVAISLLSGLFFGGVWPAPEAQAAAAWWQPTPAAPIHWQWQIGTPFNMATDLIPNVTVYNIDIFDTSATTVADLHSRGFIVIGYASFGTYEDWRPDAKSFPAEVKGGDNGWPGENWLDIRSATVKTVMAARLDLAKSKGFDAIEPDNIDGYSNSTGFPLTAQDQLTYNRWIADQCHLRGLSAGLKNDVDQASALAPYFDWTLNEEAYQYDEYSTLTAFTSLNKAVFQVEYGTSTPQASAMNGLHFNSMTRDLNLVSPGSSGYKRLPCIPDTQNAWTSGGTGSPPPTTPPPAPAPTPTANHAPVLTPIGARSATVGTRLRFTISASDTDGDALTYSATNLPAGATFSTSTLTFSWTPTVAGTYPNVGFEVSDGSLTDAESVTITVAATGAKVSANLPPVLAAIGNKTVLPGSPLKFTVNASDPEGARLTYSASNLPSGSSFSTSTRTFSWTPKTAGTYANVRFQVSDGSLADSETITITVTSTQAPVSAGGGGVSPTAGGAGFAPAGLIAGSPPAADNLSLTSSDGQATLTVPPGNSVPAGVSLVPTVVMVATTPGTQPADTGPGPISPSYAVGPADVICDPPATLTLTLEQPAMLSGVGPAGLKIAFLDTPTAAWVALENSVVAADGKTISAMIGRFGVFAVVNTIPVPVPATPETAPAETTAATNAMVPGHSRHELDVSGDSVQSMVGVTSAESSVASPDRALTVLRAAGPRPRTSRSPLPIFVSIVPWWAILVVIALEMKRRRIPVLAESAP